MLIFSEDMESVTWSHLALTSTRGIVKLGKTTALLLPGNGGILLWSIWEQCYGPYCLLSDCS